jgi:hypothetical protein
LIDLAERQGILYSHQLPAAPDNASAGSSENLVARFLANRGESCEPFRPNPIEVFDVALDGAQREAVARAVQSPDICLIQGLPGSGKSRVAAEIVTQAALRGERVLLMAPTPKALDRILHWVASRPPVLAIRCLDKEERIGDLPPEIRACTFAERSRSIAADVRAGARASVAAAEALLLSLRKDELAWPQLESLAGLWEQLEETRRELRLQRQDLATRVEEEAAALAIGPSHAFADAIRDCTSSHEEIRLRLDGELADVRAQVEKEKSKLSEVLARLAVLRPFALAEKHRRWWTFAWWRAKLGSVWRRSYEDAEASREHVEAAVSRTQLLAEAQEEQKRRDETIFREKRDQLIKGEISCRDAKLNEEEETTLREQALVRQKWQAQCAALCAHARAPHDITCIAVQSAREQWRYSLEHEERQLGLSRQWLRFLEESPDSLASRLPKYANLVAATPAAIGNDPYFGDHLRNGHSQNRKFDVLVLEDADQFTDSELLSLASRSRRWVLLGNREGVSSETSARPGLPGAERLSAPNSPFYRIWEKLHCDPRKLPYAWIQKANQLLCRLQPVSSEQRRWLETEQVADFPEIELRILAVPGAHSRLVEVAFPASMPIADAKQYIFRELQELTIRPANSSLCWMEATDRLLLRLSNKLDPSACVVELEPGVTERLAAPSLNGDISSMASWCTSSIEFDKSADWDRQRAENWIHRHLGLRDLGRTYVLETPHRMDPQLRQFVYDLLDVHAPDDQVPASTSEPALEFIAVASSTPPSNSRSIEERGRARGGAGFEVDLAEARRYDRLPAGLYDSLPRKGIVNYSEAQAVARKLLSLVSDGLGKRKSPVDSPAHEERPTIAILAFSSAQLELIRKLIDETGAVPPASFALRYGEPNDFRHSEADIVLLSLTRSHTHRAVAYAGDPANLVLGLTRARAALIVFGDPGTLARRIQWQGPLEHLDEAAANKERELLARLVNYLQGGDRRSRGTLARQASGP